MTSFLCPTDPWTDENGRRLTGAGVRVAVVDSGWNRSRIDQRVQPGMSFVDPVDDFPRSDWPDDHDHAGHGTRCAELILDIAPAVSIVPLRVFGRRMETSPQVLVEALRHATQQGVDVVNLSLGTDREDARAMLYGACDAAARSNVVIVAAAIEKGMSYPAAFDVVLSVGVAPWLDPFQFSYDAGSLIECRSPSRRATHLPGRESGGTRAPASFAAPNITGIVALWRERWPQLRLDDVRGLMAEHVERRAVASPSCPLIPDQLRA